MATGRSVGARLCRRVHCEAPSGPTPPGRPIVGLAGRGSLKAITGHGELELADGCFLRITPARRLSTYGLGLPLRRLIRDPLNAGGRLDRA